jgi:hypothetical protein
LLRAAVGMYFTSSLITRVFSQSIGAFPSVAGNAPVLPSFPTRGVCPARDALTVRQRLVAHVAGTLADQRAQAMDGLPFLVPFLLPPSCPLPPRSLTNTRSWCRRILVDPRPRPTHTLGHSPFIDLTPRLSVPPCHPTPLSCPIILLRYLAHNLILPRPTPQSCPKIFSSPGAPLQPSPSSSAEGISSRCNLSLSYALLASPPSLPFFHCRPFLTPLASCLGSRCLIPDHGCPRQRSLCRLLCPCTSRAVAVNLGILICEL